MCGKFELLCIWHLLQKLKKDLLSFLHFSCLLFWAHDVKIFCYFFSYIGLYLSIKNMHDINNN